MSLTADATHDVSPGITLHIKREPYTAFTTRRINGKVCIITQVRDDGNLIAHTKESWNEIAKRTETVWSELQKLPKQQQTPGFDPNTVREIRLHHNGTAEFDVEAKPGHDLGIKIVDSIRQKLRWDGSQPEKTIAFSADTLKALQDSLNSLQEAAKDHREMIAIPPNKDLLNNSEPPPPDPFTKTPPVSAASSAASDLRSNKALEVATLGEYFKVLAGLHPNFTSLMINDSDDIPQTTQEKILYYYRTPGAGATHYVYFFADQVSKKIFFYDSKGVSAEERAQNGNFAAVRAKVLAAHPEHTLQDIPEGVGARHQHDDGIECGVYGCIFAEKMLEVGDSTATYNAFINASIPPNQARARRGSLAQAIEGRASALTIIP